MPSLTQLFDHAVLHLCTDPLPPSLPGPHAFLRDGWQLLQKLLTNRGAIECRHLAHLFRGEVARIDQDDLICELGQPRAHAVKKCRRECVEISFDFGSTLDHSRLQGLNDRWQYQL